jgi:UDP-3-O-acyl-N-acetylglucosamine deacetylase
MRPISITGVGLFSGKPATLHILPAPLGQGLCIRRARTTDAPTPLTINFLSTRREHTCFPPGVTGRNSTIAPSRDSDFAFATVEHVLSALAGLRIHSALLELEGPEVPILEGSSLPFVDALLSAGWSASPTPAPPLVLERVVEVIDERSGSRIRATPREAPGTSYSYHLDYGPASLFPAQAAEFDSARDDYAAGVAPARTFSFLHEAQAMQKLGLFAHLSPRDMLVLNERGRPIDNTLRFENEPARHKLLDLIGDVALLGRPIQADIVAERSGHALTHELVREILRQSV